jgi:hypothetical protein
LLIVGPKQIRIHGPLLGNSVDQANASDEPCSGPDPKTRQWRQVIAEAQTRKSMVEIAVATRRFTISDIIPTLLPDESET